MVVVVSAMCPVTTALAETACTSGSAASDSSWPAGTSSTAPRRSRRFSSQRVTAQHAADGRVVAVDDHLDGAAVALANLVLQVAGQARAAGSGFGDAW